MKLGYKNYISQTEIGGGCAQCADCPPTPVLVPVCADPEFCAELIDTKCVVYTGAPLTNLGITTGERLDSILIKINNALIPVINP